MKFLQNSFVETLTDAIRLRRHRFRFRMVNIVDGQIKLIIMLFHATTELCPSVGQYPQHWQALRLVERQHAVIQHVSGCDRCFTRIQLAVRHFREGIHERLLVDATYALQITNVESIL
ncbi:Uncharacterised protein [Yersinia similis]|uniref:Uncharacterized protein n=1 Tax=Yersinia similis TaxID=367190 RepID=A0A0T9RNM0_9GAMM|nr:Uncharacterised protein [Yersinia pseudotuberculosis]CNC20542.1 Uncharacterised protein [Yersinia similis]CNG54695.1 Uncharacterised protein [Yersinia similis]CNI71583.1 Uncharacterised protein [Yersinia similis]